MPSVKGAIKNEYLLTFKYLISMVMLHGDTQREKGKTNGSELEITICFHAVNDERNDMVSFDGVEFLKYPKPMFSFQ